MDYFLKYDSVSFWYIVRRFFGKGNFASVTILLKLLCPNLNKYLQLQLISMIFTPHRRSTIKIGIHRKSTPLFWEESFFLT